MQEKDLEYLQKAVQSDFYKNDKEFVSIIRKLTQRSASLNNKAMTLVGILNEAERIKLEMIQKEIDLGLSQENKPFGEKTLEAVANTALRYTYLNNALKPSIERFIYVLEHYFDVEDTQVKKEMLKEAKEAIALLKKHAIEPSRFIINPQRSKVWYILEHAFDKTLRKHSVDFFIQKIKTTRLQHLEAVEEIKEYYQRKQRLIHALYEANTKEASKEEIEEIKAQLKEDISPTIAPLLVDTHKIMSSLDFMLEEIPQELEEEQERELREFLPVIGEYYNDQIYALSGGNAYTPVAKNLQELQQLIHDDKPASVILKEVEKLHFTMQHLYILHWIGESLMKEILKCYRHECSMGKTIRLYKKRYPNTTVDIQKTIKAVKFRNDIAHNGVIWDPKGIENAISGYREHIDKVSDEREFPLERFQLKRMHRKLTQEQKKARIEEFCDRLLHARIDAIPKPLYNELASELERKHWDLPKQRVNYYRREIHKTAIDSFVKKHFDLDFETMKRYLVEFAKKENFFYNEEKGETLEGVAVGAFFFAFYNYEDPSKRKKAQEKIKELRQRIEAVSDKRYGVFTRIFQ